MKKNEKMKNEKNEKKMKKWKKNEKKYFGPVFSTERIRGVAESVQLHKAGRWAPGEVQKFQGGIKSRKGLEKNGQHRMTHDVRQQRTVLSRGVRSLFGPTGKLSTWGNFSGRLNQSIKRRLSL